MNSFLVFILSTIISFGFIIWFHNKRIQEYKDLQLKQMLKMSELSEFGKMAIGLVHELSNPLSTVSLNLELLQDEMISDENGSVRCNDTQSRAISRSVAGVKRMRVLIEEGREQLQQNGSILEENLPLSFLVNDEIESIISSLEHKAKEKNVQFIFKINRKSGSEILAGSRVKFSQVITTVIANAVDSYSCCDFYDSYNSCDNIPYKKQCYKKCSKNIVDIRTIFDNSKIIVEVRDKGSGIPIKSQKNLYHPLSSTKKPELGMGIGLFLSKSILETDFGGEISYSTESNKGTKFIISFPRDSTFET